MNMKILTEKKGKEKKGEKKKETSSARRIPSGTMAVMK